MRRLKAGIRLVIAALALSAAVASSASALPEWSGPFPKPFVSNGNPARLETPKPTEVRCTGNTNDVGEISAANSGRIEIHFTGCQSSGQPCSSHGAATGEIVTPPLAMTLGYIRARSKNVGLDVANPANGVFAEFECPNVKERVTGSLIGKITPVNKAVKPGHHFTVKYRGREGTQMPTGFEGGPPDFLKASINGGPLEPMSLGSADALNFGAATVTIKA